MKRILKIFGYIALFLLLVVLALPTIISQPSVHKFVIGVINARIPGKISLSSLSLGWMSGIHLQDLAVKDPEGRSVLEVKNIELTESLTKIITSPLEIGKLQVTEPRCILIEEQGSYSLERAFSTPEPKEKKHKKHSSSTSHKSSSQATSLIPLFADIAVENGFVAIQKEKSDEIAIKNINCKVKINGFKEAVATLSADITKGKEGKKTGKIDIQATGKNYEKRETAALNASCTLSHIPVDIADTFITLSEPKLEGIAQAAIGPTLDVNIQSSFKDSALDLKATVQSAALQANVSMNKSTNEVTVGAEAPGIINWKITPEVVQKLKSIVPALEPLELLQPMPIQVVVRPESISVTIDSCRLKDTKNNQTIAIDLKGQLDNLFEKEEKKPLVVAADIKVTLDDKLSPHVGKEVRLSFKSELPSAGSDEIRAIATVSTDKLPKPLQFGLLFNTASTNPKGIFSMDDLFGGYVVTAPFEYNSKKELFSVHCDVRQKESSQIVIKSDIQAGKDGIVTTGTIHDLPLEPIATYFKKRDLLELIGKTVSGSWKLSEAKEIEADLHTTGLSCNLAAVVQSDQITGISNKKPLSFKTTITPERFKAIINTFDLVSSDQLKGFDLKNPCDLQLACTKLELPLPFSLNALGLELSFESDKLQIGSNTIFPLQATCKVEKGSKRATFELKSKEGRQIAITGKAENLWNEQGLQLNEAEIELESHIDELPIDLFKRFTCSKKAGKQVEALIGSSIDVNASLKLSKMQEGTLEAALEGDNCKLEASSKVSQGKLYLNKPITASLKLSKETGKTLFKDINPLLATGMHADHPITVFIDNDGFVLPLKPFSKQGIQIKNVRLDLGKLNVQKGGALDMVSTLLNLPSEKEMNLWMTPLFIEVRHGIVYCKRVDALLDNTVSIASWGTIDLVSDRVDMIVGIFGAGLSRALHLQNLPPNYVLQLPLRGTTTSAAIDKTRAVAKIASLRMSESSNQTQALIGGLLGAAASVAEKEAPVPPPTTYPFPWEQ